MHSLSASWKRSPHRIPEHEEGSTHHGWSVSWQPRSGRLGLHTPLWRFQERDVRLRAPHHEQPDGTESRRRRASGRQGIVRSGGGDGFKLCKKRHHVLDTQVETQWLENQFKSARHKPGLVDGTGPTVRAAQNRKAMPCTPIIIAATSWQLPPPVTNPHRCSPSSSLDPGKSRKINRASTATKMPDGLHADRKVSDHFYRAAPYRHWIVVTAFGAGSKSSLTRAVFWASYPANCATADCY